MIEPGFIPHTIMTAGGSRGSTGRLKVIKSFRLYNESGKWRYGIVDNTIITHALRFPFLFLLQHSASLIQLQCHGAFLAWRGGLLDGLLLMASWHVVLVISYVKREVVVSMHEVYKRAIEFDLAQERACRGQNLQQDENMDTS